MAELTVANYLAALQDDPWDESALSALEAALASEDPKQRGEDPVRLLEFARRSHEVRGENYAAARLMAVEVSLLSNDPDFAAVLWRELGRVRREELMDDSGAREAYQRALELRPGDEEVERALAQIEQVSERWQEISRHFIEQAEQASEASLRASLLLRAASIIWQYKKRGRGKETDRLFQEALATEPASARAVRLYELTLRERNKWAELATVLLKVAEQMDGKDVRLGLFLGAARVFARRLEDHARAAACYERVLEVAPAHEESLGFLVAHFTEQKDWEHLVAVYEDALRARQLSAEAEQGILLQIAMVQWRMLERADRAEPYFARVRKADPAQPVMLDFYRERYTASAESNKLLAVLSDAQRRAEREADKAALALEIARLAKHDAQSAERAIDAFKLVLRHDPHHQEARSSLKELYRRSGKWNALVELLRSELEALEEADTRGKLLLLKEMLTIYRDELELDATVLSTYNAILQLDPSDREATLELAKTYEQMGRYNDLIPVLLREAEVEDDEAQKIALYLRVARLWVEHFSNFNQATGPLEQVLALDPGHPEALTALRDIYAKKRAWPKLAEVLAKQEELERDPDTKHALLLELASLTGERLHDYPRAIELYKRLLALDPRTPGVLDALEKLAERAKDWSTLADVLEQRASEIEEFSAKTKLLMRLGTLHSERTQNPQLAASAWKRVLELDPKNGRALRTLREAYLAAGDFASVESLYADAGDWEGFVDVLGSAADRAPDPEHKKALSFRAAEVYERELKEPARAFRSYERVLAIDPENERAVRALLPIYEKDEKWPRVAQLNEVLLAKLKAADEPAARAAELELELRLSELFQTKLRDGERAFVHATAAYALAPEDERAQKWLESAAELALAHERLVALYVERAAHAEPDEAIGLRRRAAQLWAERLKRPEQAASQLELIVNEQPHDEAARSALERIYRSTGRGQELAALYTRMLEHARNEHERAELLRERARIEEELLVDVDAATATQRALYALKPDDVGALASLDKLLAAKGHHQELLPVLEARVELSTDRKEQTELLLRIGRLAHVELLDVARAIDAFTRVLEIEPTEPHAVEQLEQIADSRASEALAIGRLLEPVYERTAKLDKLVRVLKRRLESTLDGDERRLLRLRLAELEGDLGDPKSAYATLESAFLDNPHNAELWERITHVAEQADAMEELAVAFSTAIEMGDLSPADVAALSARTARIHEEVLGQVERAEPFYRRVLAFDPLDDVAYRGLRELYTTNDRWEELKLLYRERLEHTTEPAQRLELQLQVCFLYEEILDDVEMAIGAYEAVLELSPAHPTSRRALERLYTRAGQFRELVRLLEADRAESEGKEAIELTYRIGELYEHKLDEAQLAVDQYASVLEAQPTHLRAQEALSRLLSVRSERQRVAGLLEPIYAAQGAHVELAQVLEVQLEQVSEPGARVAVLLRLGELRERELRDLDGAYHAYARAVEADPTDAHARGELGRMASLAGKVSERARLLEELLEQTSESRTRAELLTELAEVYHYGLADPARALDAYKRLIQVDPSDAEVVLPAARALERLHAERGDHAALADDLRLQVSFERESAERAGLLLRLAELAERELSDPLRAIEAYVERLELEPTDVVTLSALERLYAAQRDYPRLIAILQRRDVAAEDEAEARQLARRIGEIYERELGDADSAVQAYHDVLGRFGRDRETLQALQRVHEAAGRHVELLDVVSQELELTSDSAERAALAFRAAELMRQHTGAPEAALESYRSVLEAQPGHEGALAALASMMTECHPPLRVEAARLLVPEYAALGANEKLLAALDVVAEGDDPRERIEALRRASTVAERDLGQLDQAYRFASRALRAGLDEHDLGELLDEVERLSRGARAQRDYVALLQEVAKAIPNEELSLRALMSAARVARDDLQEPEEARALFERVLTIRPDSGPALDALESLHAEAGDHAGLLAVLVQKGDLAIDPAERARLLLRQGELAAGELDDVPRAIEAYERLLDEAPSERVFSGLEALYERAGRHQELGTMYERQLDLGVGDGVLVRFKLAELSRTRRGDSERALDLYQEVLERSPLHDGARLALEQLMEHRSHRARAAELLEPLYLRSERWAELARALEAQLEVTDDTERKKELLGRLAQLHELQLESLESALDTHARLFRADPGDQHTTEALSRLARVLGQQLRVAEIYEAYLDELGVHDALGVRLAVAAAEIREQFGDDLSRATGLYQKALAFDPSARPLAEALEQLLLRRGAHEELRAFYRAQADLSVDASYRLEMLRKLAVVTERELREVEAAIRVHQEIVELAPRDRDANAALERLLAETKAWSELADHLRHQVDQALGTSLEIDLKLRLAQLFEREIEDIELAIDTHEEVLRLAPDNATARADLERLAERPELRKRIAEILDPLYEESAQWSKQIWIAEKLVAIQPDAAERSELYRRIARLQEQHGKAPRAALEANRRALVTWPGDAEARTELERLAERLGDWDALAAALEEAAAVSNDGELKASLLGSIARTHDEKRGDPRSAIEAYERLVQTDTDDVAAYDQLEALLTMVGDWTGLVGLLTRKVERSYDSVERAELLRRAASVLDELIGDTPGAIRAYAAALAEVDDDEVSLACLDELYERTEDHASLVEVLRKRAELTHDAEVRVELNMRLGAVLAEKLRRPREAIDAYGRALEDDPARLDALVALGRLYASESLWTELLENLRRQLELLPEQDGASAPRSARLGLVYAMGQVHDEHLSEFEEAVECYREALALDASHEPSIRALLRIGEQAEYRFRAEEILEPILRDSARWDDLATLLSRGVGGIVDVVDRQARLLRLAEIHEAGRNDLAAAFDALSEALVQDYDDRRIPEEVERLAGRLSTWDRAAEVLGYRAGKTSDAEFARELHGRVARICERELADVGRTIQTYELALQRSGDDDGMLAELDRLYTASEGYEALADVLERRVPYAFGGSAAELLVRLGELREQRFGEAAAALDAYRDALEREPGHPGAVASLERLLTHRELANEVVELLDRAYRDAGDLTRVASLFETRAQFAESQPERARLLGELATLYEHDLRDLGKAAETLRRAFEADSSDFGLLDEIERVAHAAGRFDVLSGLVETAVGSRELARTDRRDLWMRAAAWYRDRTSDLPRAEHALRQSIDVDPEYEPAHEALVTLLRREGRHRDLVDALFVWAEREPDRVVAAERFTEAAVIAESAAGDSERAVEAYDRVLALDPAQLHALDALIRIYEASGKLGKVAQLYERRIEAEVDITTRIELRHRAARLRAERLDDRDGAIRLELDNLDEEPSNVVALNSLEQLYEALERWPALSELLARRLELADSVEERTRARVRLALIAERRLGDRARAIEELREIVLEEPRHEGANEALERLLEAEGRFAELVDQLERRTDLAREAGDGALEVALYARLGELVEQRLEDAPRATDFYERVLERDPAHPVALRALARLHLLRGEPGRAAELLESLVAQLSGVELIDASYALAEIAESMGENDRAEAALRRALAAGQRESETRERLLHLFERAGSHAQLAELLAAEAEQTSDIAQRVAFLRRAAELHRDMLHDPARAATLLERASEIVPEERSVLVPLCELYIAAERQRDAVPVLEKIIATYGGRRVKDVAVYRRMLAQAYRGLGDPARALTELDAAYRIDLTNVAVLADLGLLAFEQGDLERAQKTFRGLLLQKLDRDAPLSKADVYYYLGDISAQQGDGSKAISMVERALAEQPRHERARSLLARLKG